MNAMRQVISRPSKCVDAGTQKLLTVKCRYERASQVLRVRRIL